MLGEAEMNARSDRPTQPPTQRVHETTQPFATPCEAKTDSASNVDGRKSLCLAKIDDEIRKDARHSANGPCWIRTSDHQIMSPAL